MNRWTYSINEVSPGVYDIEAIRDTHNSIARKGFETAISEVLRDSFQMELTFGTNPAEAAFHVTKGYKNFWTSTYYENAYGSWEIHYPKTKSRIELDGKDSYISMIYNPSKSTEAYWNGWLPDLLKPDCAYFQKLLYFY